MNLAVLGENDETLDAEGPLAIHRPPSWQREDSTFEMELLEGDEGSLESPSSLLQTRLRFAALALGIGFTGFCGWSWLHKITGGVSGILDLPELLFESFLTCALLGMAWWLGWVPKASQACLRWCELVVFGLPAIFFAILQYKELLFIVANFAVVPHMPISSWLTLIYAYAIFMPHSWRHVLWVVTSIAAMPIIATFVCMLFHADTRSSIMFDPSSTVEMVLVLSLSVFTSVWSVIMVTHLQRKADQAKELGRYRLKEKLGSGGMGDVYLAEHRLMKRPCAIKVIRPDKSGDPRAIARFEREVRATAKLRHWNSVSIYDYGRTRDGKFFYVMEYLTGLSLQELVKRRGPLSPARAVYLLKQICRALVEAHGIPLVHRDIKPANVMVTELGGQYDMAKLLDFGLAKPASGDTESQELSELTLAGSLTGSPLYISPEQAMGDVGPDHRSDIYGVGGIAYYMLTGQPPFPSGPTLKILMAHVHEVPLPPSVKRAQVIPTAPTRPNAHVSQGLDDVILRCLAKSPKDRFQSVRDILRALEELPENSGWDNDCAERWWKANCISSENASNKLDHGC